MAGIVAFEGRDDLGSSKARLGGEDLATLHGDAAVPAVAPPARAPTELDKEHGLRLPRDRRRRDLRGDPVDEPAVADDVDRVDEPGGHGLDAKAPFGQRRNDAALAGRADSGEKVDVVSRERVGPARPHRLPDRGAVAARRVDRHAAVTVGAGKGRVVVRVADHPEDMSGGEPVLHRRPAVRGTHRMEVAPIRLGGLGAAVHRVHLDEGRQLRIEAVPIDAARAQPVADVMGESEGATRELGLEPPPQLGGAVGQDQGRRVEVAVDDGVVAMGGGVDLVARKDDEPIRAGRRERREVPGPTLPQPGEALHVEGDDVGDARIVDRHVGPVGVAGDRHEIELQRRPRQGVGEAAVPVAQVAMVVDVAIAAARARARRRAASAETAGARGSWSEVSVTAVRLRRRSVPDRARSAAEHPCARPGRRPRS